MRNVLVKPIEVYGNSVTTNKSYSEWLRRLKFGDFRLEKKERPNGQPKKHADHGLQPLLVQYLGQRQTELIESMEGT